MRKQLIEASNEALRAHAKRLQSALDEAYESDYSSEYASLLSSLHEVNTILEQREQLHKELDAHLHHIHRLKEHAANFLDPISQFNLILDALVEQENENHQKALHELNQGAYIQEELTSLEDKHAQRIELLQNKKEQVEKKLEEIQAIKAEIDAAIKNNDVETYRKQKFKLDAATKELYKLLDLEKERKGTGFEIKNVVFDHANKEKIINELDMLIAEEIDAYRKEQAQELINEVKQNMEVAQVFFDEANKIKQQEEAENRQRHNIEQEIGESQETYIGQRWVKYAKKKSDEVLESSKRATTAFAQTAKILIDDVTQTKVVINKENIISRLDHDLEKFKYALQHLKNPLHIENCKRHIEATERRKQEALLLLDKKLSGKKIQNHEERLNMLKEKRAQLLASLGKLEAGTTTLFDTIPEQSLSALATEDLASNTENIALPIIDEQFQELKIEDIPEYDTIKSDLQFEIDRRHLVQEELDKADTQDTEKFMQKASEIYDFLHGTNFQIDGLRISISLNDKLERKFKQYKFYQEYLDMERLESQYQDEDVYGDKALARRLKSKIDAKKQVLQDLANELNIDLEIIDLPTPYKMKKLQSELITLSNRSIEETGYVHKLHRAIISYCRKQLKKNATFKADVSKEIMDKTKTINEEAGLMSDEILDQLLLLTDVLLPTEETNNSHFDKIIEEENDNITNISNHFSDIEIQLMGYPLAIHDHVNHHITQHSNAWLEKAASVANVLTSAKHEIHVLQDALIEAQNNIRDQLDDKMAEVVEQLRSEMQIEAELMIKPAASELYNNILEDYLYDISNNPGGYKQEKINRLKTIRALVVANQELFVDTYDDDTELVQQLKQEYNEMIIAKLAKVARKPHRVENVIPQLSQAKQRFDFFLPAQQFIAIPIKDHYPKRVKGMLKLINQDLAYDYKKTLLAPDMDPRDWISLRKSYAEKEILLADMHNLLIEKTGNYLLDKIIEKINKETDVEIANFLRGRPIDVEKIKARKTHFDKILSVYHEMIIPEDGNPITMNMQQSLNKKITNHINSALTAVVNNDKDLEKIIDRHLRMATNKREEFDSTWEKAITDYQIVTDFSVPGHIADIVDEYHIGLIKAIEKSLKIPYYEFSEQKYEKQQIELALDHYQHNYRRISNDDSNNIKAKKNKFNMLLGIDLARLLRTNKLDQYLDVHIAAVEEHSLSTDLVDLANNQFIKEILSEKQFFEPGDLKQISKQIKTLLELQHQLHITIDNEYEDEIRNEIKNFNASIDQKIRDAIINLEPDNVLENLRIQRNEFLTNLFSDRVLSRCNTPNKYPLKNIMKLTSIYSGDNKVVIAKLLAEVTSSGDELAQNLAKIEGDTDAETNVIESYYRKAAMAFHEAKTNNLNSEDTHLARQKGMIVEALLKETKRMEKTLKYAVSKPYIYDTKIKLANIRGELLDRDSGWLLRIQKAKDQEALATILDEMINSHSVNMRRSSNPISRMFKDVLGTISETETRRKLEQTKEKILRLDKKYIYSTHKNAPAA